MSSILNSISPGNLLVQRAPKDKPVKKDSIIELLQNSEIEFETCSKLENNMLDIDTGFGYNNDLHYESLCTKPELKTPLYLENFLREFVTEEEKAAARHSLGLYNKGDVVAMSLLTTETSKPTTWDWANAEVKQLKLGDVFFTPITSFNAVYNSEGDTLDGVVNEVQSLLTQQQKEITKIIEPSKTTEISSLGDVRLFLKGFNNGENLHETVEDINKNMLRFESTGLIII